MKKQRGQVLLLVVLTMVVALTVGLSIASRVVTELKISKQNEESQRAFQAAEAGIQQTLKQGSNISSRDLDNNAELSTIIDNSTTQGLAIDVNTGIPVDQDTGADVWLSVYNPDITASFTSPMDASGAGVDIYWGSSTQTNCTVPPGDTIVPALEVAILQGPTNFPTIKKYLFEDPGCGNSRIPVGYDAATPGSFLRGTETYSYKANIKFTSGLVMKVIPIFNSTIIRVESLTTPFPNQGSVVTAKGKSGETARQIRYYTSLPQLPIEVFPYSIISQ